MVGATLAVALVVLQACRPYGMLTASNDTL